MARIAGVNIPTSKRVPIALTYIHGIGPAVAKSICEAIGIDSTRRVNELSDAEVLQIREHIDANVTVEGDLRREVQMNIKRLMDLGCYRGLRHRRNLEPVDELWRGCLVASLRVREVFLPLRLGARHGDDALENGHQKLQDELQVQMRTHLRQVDVLHIFLLFERRCFSFSSF